MSNFDLCGQTFGDLTVFSQALSKGGRRRWRCRCICEKETIVSSDKLRSGHTRSCGCWRTRKIPPEERFWLKVKKLRKKQCWEWLAGTDTGFGYGVFAHSHGNVERAHRAAYRFYFGDFDPALCVLHKCDNPTCVNPHHLFLGTRLDNNNDKIAKKRHRFGETHPFAKLTVDNVVEIRRRHSLGVGYRKLAVVFGVSITTIENAVTRKTWKHV